MKRYFIHLSSVVFIVLAVAIGWLFLASAQPFEAASNSDAREDGANLYVYGDSYNNDLIQPIPSVIKLNQGKVALGERLFNEPRLSRDNTISCATCHDLNAGGTDKQIYSLGSNGETGNMNSPTVFNSGLNFKQFWDGRADTLEDQVEEPVNHPKEMASNWPQVIGKLRNDAGYVSKFKQLYPDGITSTNIKDAIATFERSLITPNSRFDKYLRGDESAISADEKAGYELFKSYGCVVCHQGRNVGGNMFSVMGITADYFGDRGDETKIDLGRFNVTRDKEDLYKFKVPSLRLVVLTAPYFHNGRVQDLSTAIDYMAKYQLGRHITPEDKQLIIKFLYTLPGEYKGKPLL